MLLLVFVGAVRQPLADDVPDYRRAAKYAATDGFRDLAVAAESNYQPGDKSSECHPQLAAGHLAFPINFHDVFPPFPSHLCGGL